VDNDVDFLIVGSGIAGLRAAIELAGAGRVLILTKADTAESNTGYAQGGIAAAMDANDSPALHAEDTIKAGDGLCEDLAVRVLVENGPVYVNELIGWGARFDLDDVGRPALGLEAAHSVRRVLHAGDATGREIARALWARVVDQTAVESISHALVTELITEGGVVCGARFFDRAGTRQEMRASATLLATGGAGQVFRETTNPGIATGDGLALAYHAGARVADLEFVQFHPTALNRANAPRFLISEALRGEGARLVNASGEPFMKRYHPSGDLAPRDVVARSIVREADKTGGGVFLSMSHLEAVRVRARFPTIAATCELVGLDIATDPIPVLPAAHYLMGGVETDEWGRSSLAGLYAAGEVACTGVHGANRLASNSLLEGLVFGGRAAHAMKTGTRAIRDLRAGWKLAAPLDPASLGPERVPPQGELRDVAAVRDLMWRAVGLFRARADLQDAVVRLDAAYQRSRLAVETASPANADDWRYFNLVTVARLIALAALRREESRGGHFRTDFPARDDLHWKTHFADARPQ
jgi:L-aspartate oxidase